MRRDCYNDGENPTLGPAPTGASPRSERLGHPGPRRWPHLRPRAGPLAHLPLGDLRQAQGFKQRVSSRDPHIRSAPAAGPVRPGLSGGHRTSPSPGPASGMCRLLSRLLLSPSRRHLGSSPPRTPRQRPLSLQTRPARSPLSLPVRPAPVRPVASLLDWCSLSAPTADPVTRGT